MGRKQVDRATGMPGSKEAIWAFDHGAWVRVPNILGAVDAAGCCFAGLDRSGASGPRRRTALIFAECTCMWRTEMIEEARKEAEGVRPTPS